MKFHYIILESRYNDVMSYTYTAPAIAVERSADRKLSTDKTVSATWASQGSCPANCSFYLSGCYAETGHAGITTKRLNMAQSIGMFTPEQIARFEADAVNRLKGKYDLRGHVVGDCKTVEAARIVSEAYNAYIKRSGKRVWTYTHALDVPRSVWGDVSILRSCESVEQLQVEHDRGYACSLVVPTKHESHRPVNLGNGFTGIPCPYQVKKTESCKACGLCMQDKHLHRRKLVILFAPDSGTDKKIKKALQVLPMA